MDELRSLPIAYVIAASVMLGAGLGGFAAVGILFWLAKVGEGKTYLPGVFYRKDMEERGREKP